MAFSVHVVSLAMQSVDMMGNVINKESASMQERLNSSLETRVIPDSNIPSSAGSPTIKEYLELEAAEGFVLKHIDQSFIVTYPKSAG